ncbi:CBS domain-containing protein [Reinekea thalattae]|uniref:CBS domain-containing protein n=1 Tax=Reinekea thalattae TaxID=2593301 RepID=A0A5C8Z980_9GAMM|nr:CBS domain-containing protein [Reinekea thalattae]TXR53768.1 CBS domain-containing protein [Reinekea thalattae]
MAVHAMTVADCMVPPKLTLKAEITIHDAVRKMIQAHVIGAAVLDEQAHVVGYISEQDCLQHLLNESYHHEGQMLVNDVMHKDVLFALPDMSIVDLAQLMCGNKPKKYPVCSPSGRLLGIITRTQVLQALLKQG